MTRDDFWAYVVIDGDAEMSEVATKPDDPGVDELVEYYRALAGEHPDWDDYRKVMVADKRVVVHALEVRRTPTAMLRSRSVSESVTGGEGDRHVRGAEDADALGLPRDVAVDRQLRHALRQQRQRLLQLGACQRRAEAVVDARTERQLRLAGGLGRDVERLRLVEHRGIAVCLGQADRHERAGREQHVAVLDVAAGEPSGAAHRAEVAHRLLDGARCELGPLGEQAPTDRDARRTSATAQPSWLRVVSVPPTMTALTIITSSSLLSLSPASSAAIRSVSRSSAGLLRRSAMRPRVYSPSSSCVRMMRSSLSTTSSEKISRMSPAQRLNNCQSFFGAPSSSQMIGIGYGSQMSVAKSARPAAATLSTSPPMTSRMNGRRRSAARGENAGATRRRRRVCMSPSADRMLTCCRSRKSVLVMPISSGIRLTALCHRLSRRIAGGVLVVQHLVAEHVAHEPLIAGSTTRMRRASLVVADRRW